MIKLRHQRLQLTLAIEMGPKGATVVLLHEGLLIPPSGTPPLMLSQAQANRLIVELKTAARTTTFVWENEQRQDETLVAVGDAKLQFVMTLSRNPFEIRIHARTRDRNIGLLRIDNAPYHQNPDGTELRDTAHLHVYREGFDLAWAEPVDWYDLTNPLRTMERFLSEFSARFPSGITVAMV